MAKVRLRVSINRVAPDTVEHRHVLMRNLKEVVRLFLEEPIEWARFRLSISYNNWCGSLSRSQTLLLPDLLQFLTKQGERSLIPLRPRCRRRGGLVAAPWRAPAEASRH